MNVFRWILSIFKRSSEQDRFDIYSPKQRRIYSYFNGEKMVVVDPMHQYKAVMEKGPDIAIDLKVSNSISKDANKSHENLIKTVRGIFNVKPLAEGGLTDLEAIELLDHFLVYCGEIKKKQNLSVMSWNPSGVSQTTSVSENPPILNSLDSGSTGNELNIGEPPSLPLAAVLQTDQ